MEKKETIPSYKRRLNDWDYTQPRIYMLTLATERREPLLGTLTGDVSQPTGSPEGPRLVPSALGAAVLQEVDGIPRYYPQITIIARQLMPDHLHILLYVTRPLPVHLGQLQRLVDYIRENPRRSLIKRQHASWFRPFCL
ncbi:MAG: hypothetical protein J6N98_08485 [Prevotella sp.]|nr:hypothetical protein [Prevotella sp.]